MNQLLDPKTLMAIKNLALAARTTVEGFRSGIHASALKGHGLEFSQYRSYQPGDDLRQLDWKMFARSDRYYIRESEVESSIAVRFLMDASASMNHQDGAFSKMDYARYLAASLAYLASQQGDATGLYVFQGPYFYTMAPRRDYQHLGRFFHQLEQIAPEGMFTQPAHYQDLYAGARRRELMILLTDMYETHAEIVQLLDTLVALGHEVIVFHLMSRNELTLDYRGYGLLEDLETGETVALNPAQAQKTYVQKLQVYLQDTKKKMLNRRIFYRMMVTDQPVGQALRDFLIQRSTLTV